MSFNLYYEKFIYFFLFENKIEKEINNHLFLENIVKKIERYKKNYES